MSRPRVTVVGGGVMGCTLAYALARRGVEVLLLERAPNGAGGASGVPVALLNPHRGRSGRASEADLSALQATWTLVAALEAAGHRTGAVRSGVLRIASDSKQARRWAQLPGVNWFGPDAVPEAVAASGFHTPFGGFLVPVGGWVEPARYLAALRAAACAHGAVVLAGCDVTAVTRGPEGYTLATSGGVLHAGAVALCVGAHALPTLPAEAAPRPDVARVAGETVGLALSTPPAYPLAGAVYGAYVAGTFYLGGNHRPADQDDPSAPEKLQRAGRWFLPALGGAPQQTLWSGVRAKTEDHRPLVLELSPNLLFAGALAGRGFLAAAALAEGLAETLRARWSPGRPL